MDFVTKLDTLMCQRKLNKHTLAQQSGIPYTTIVGLFPRGKENARLSTVNRLCDFFGVPLDYLAVDKYESPEDFIPGNRESSILTSGADETRLVMCYRLLNDTGKKAALSTLEGLTAHPEFREVSTSETTA